MYEYLLELQAFISQPWPWWMGAVIIGSTMFFLLLFDKEFGLSANLRTMCAADGAGDYADFFNFDWEKQGWNLMVALGALFGAYFAANYFGGDYQAHVSEATVETLNEIAGDDILKYGEVPLVPGKTVIKTDVPEFWDIYSWESLFTVRGIIIIVLGGFLIGFGARYAGGCTSGHAISGLSDLQIPSLVAVIGFFIGGLIATHFILPYILNIGF
ncbi:MAG: YeeE/YedE thiosulfate transporter family protein [Bacteroidota bacterium]